MKIKLKMEDILVTEATSVTEKFLTTGCLNLDRILKGGVPCRGITQVYGAAGTGKTQLALQLCLTVQLPITAGGLGAGAIYICTETAFPSRRLQQLIENSEIAKTYSTSGDVIFVNHIATIDELESCLQHKVPILMNTHKIGLLVIDSIAAPYRVEDWKGSRAKNLRNVGRQLHELCKNNDLCVICINQVSAVMDNHSYTSEGVDEQPALGFTWSSMITTSLYFYRRVSSRYACVMLASHLPKITFQFEVHESGIRGIE
ncbi:DNA repair protein XRCC3 [Ooceraea biroi]|uniref:DNA repair protein XRCC3 n=1 Tax=Ooceraea biroi TaxID=2015173 RepID=A0A026WYN0_OOCBI|nr:DNA repair protein XRCC3 [Ooceraea biroi]